MCTRQQCEQYVGQWVRFRTPYGVHQGMIERVTPSKAIVVSPQQYAPAELISDKVDASDMEKLDIALAWGPVGRGAVGYPGAGYGARAGAGYGGGYGGYGYGWARWAVSFLVIYALFGLWAW